MSILDLPLENVFKQIAALDRGLPSNSLGRLADVLGLPKAVLAHGLRLPARTVAHREKSRHAFSPDESERLLRLARVHHMAREVFTDDGAVAEWLRQPDRSLRNRTPLDMLPTDLGARKVENLIEAMIHGVPV